MDADCCHAASTEQAGSVIAAPLGLWNQLSVSGLSASVLYVLCDVYVCSDQLHLDLLRTSAVAALFTWSEVGHVLKVWGIGLS